MAYPQDKAIAAAHYVYTEGKPLPDLRAVVTPLAGHYCHVANSVLMKTKAWMESRVAGHSKSEPGVFLSTNRYTIGIFET